MIRPLWIRGLMVLAIAAGADAQPVRFAVINDTQGVDGAIINDAVFGQVIDNVLAADPPVDLVVVCGDLVHGQGTGFAVEQQLRSWRTVAAPLYQADMRGLKVYPSPGNHDLVHLYTAGDIWRRVFPELPDNGPADEKQLTYSFDIGPVHFVSVCTSRPRSDHQVDRAWLAEDLADSDAPVTFVYGHEPAYPVGPHAGYSLDRHPLKRDLFWRILAENGVLAYFCGHEHLHDHWVKDGVHQIVNGSSGGAGQFYSHLIVDVDEEHRVTVSVHTPDGVLHEQYVLNGSNDVADEPRGDAPSLAFELLTGCPGLFAMMLAACVAGFCALTPARGPRR